MARRRRELGDRLDRNDLPDLALAEFHADEVRVPVRVANPGRAFAAGTGVSLGRRLSVAYSHTGVKLCEWDPEKARSDAAALRGRRWLASAGRRLGKVEWMIREIDPRPRNGNVRVVGGRWASEAEAELLDRTFPGHLDGWRSRLASGGA